MILEPITKHDIIAAFRKLHNINLYEEDITFLSDRAHNYYGYGQLPLP